MLLHNPLEFASHSIPARGDSLSLQQSQFGSFDESKSCSAISDSLQLHRLYSPWNSLGQDIGVGSLFLLQGIFLRDQIQSPALQAVSLPTELGLIHFAVQ